jgi:D-alanyl-lipoteichoic acid acyltransferase DltB (MBOAT superfamily)
VSLINLSLLGTFKYFNFFVDGMHDLLATVGLQPNLPLLRILLPVGDQFLHLPITELYHRHPAG